MENLPSKEDFENLKNELKHVKAELKRTKTNASPQTVKQVDQSEEIFGKLLEKGVEIFDKWTNGQIETEKYSIDKKLEAEIKKYSIVDRIDKRNNTIKVVLTIVTLTLLGFLAAIDKLGEGSVAIIIFIITAMFKDSVKDFFKDIHKSFRRDEN